uniref:RED-like N-terminal domain-containing protein n=1 Tax=Amphimedon queenslandica TaxID=400682 RepID=A0A1X7UYX3_AMPQE
MVVRDQEAEEIKKYERRRKKKRKRRDLSVLVRRDQSTKNIHSIVFQTNAPEKNEFFLPGRMAYVFELDDEYEESDIPTTLIRSKADCPMLESQATLTTNDIVINKLTQILSYLRQGSKKLKKKEKGADIIDYSAPKKPAVQKEESIFPDMGEYDFDASAVPSDLSKRDQQLFTKSEPTQDYEDIKKATKEFVKAVWKKYADSSSIPGERTHSDGPLPSGWSAGEVDRTHARSSSTKTTEPVLMKKAKTDDVGFGGLDHDHYAECCPGGMEEVDATVNSDDEIDFSKMDMGNRKGPVKRWDFENEEDYGNYQSSREALPKAAFQFGVKMNDGCKTRRQGVKNEKAKLGQRMAADQSDSSKKKVK